MNVNDCTSSCALMDVTPASSSFLRIIGNTSEVELFQLLAVHDSQRAHRCDVFTEMPRTEQ